MCGEMKGHVGVGLLFTHMTFLSDSTAFFMHKGAIFTPLSAPERVPAL